MWRIPRHTTLLCILPPIELPLARLLDGRRIGGLISTILQVITHAGGPFKLMELLAQDMHGDSCTCMYALRAAHSLTLSHKDSMEALDKIGVKMVLPLINLLDIAKPQLATAATEIVALLAKSANNKSRMCAAGGIVRLVCLLRSGHTATAAASLDALSQLAKADGKLALELLSCQAMPGILQLLSHGSCMTAALALLGDLVGVPQGRRALLADEGAKVLSAFVQVSITTGRDLISLYLP